MTDTGADMKLKPCPFCGGKNIYISYCDPGWFGGEPRLVRCDDCGLDLPAPKAHSTEEETIKHWNTRHLPVGAIRKALVLLENEISKLFDEQADPYFTDEYRNAAENLAYEKEKIAEQLRAMLEGE